MATISPPPGSDWSWALKSAKPGDTIQLSPGSYPYVSAYGPAYDKTSPVAITGPRTAVISGLSIQSCGGYHISGVTLLSTAKPALQILTAHDVEVENVFVTQNPAASNAEVRNLWGMGIKVVSSSHIHIHNSEFAFIGFGVAHQTPNELSITDNFFHHISNDGIRGNSSNVSILRNTFTDFFLATQLDGSRVHGDAIQFFTSGRTTPINDTIIADNHLFRGAGDTMSNLQLGDEADRVAWPWPVLNVGYTNLQIYGNLFAAGGNFGVEGAVNPHIHDNLFTCTTADTHPVKDPKTGALVEQAYWPRIVLSHSRGGLIHDNCGVALPQFYQCFADGATKDNLVDLALQGAPGEYGRAKIWWAGRRGARGA